MENLLWTGATVPSSWFNSIVPDNNAKIKSLAWVNQTVDQSTQNIYSQDEFTWDVNKIMSAKWIDYDTAFDSTKEYYTSKGYSVKWFESDFAPQEVEEPLIEEPEDRQWFDLWLDAAEWLQNLWK